MYVDNLNIISHKVVFLSKGLYLTHLNRIVEKRKNKTLVKMERCLLQEKGLPMKFWIEVVNCSNYIMNLVPTRVLYNKMPPLHWKLGWNAKNIFLHENLVRKLSTLLDSQQLSLSTCLASLYPALTMHPVNMQVMLITHADNCQVALTPF